jgi:hypothetical protein
MYCELKSINKNDSYCCFLVDLAESKSHKFSITDEIHVRVRFYN